MFFEKKEVFYLSLDDSLIILRDGMFIVRVWIRNVFYKFLCVNIWFLVGVLLGSLMGWDGLLLGIIFWIIVWFWVGFDLFFIVVIKNIIIKSNVSLFYFIVYSVMR